MGVSFQQRAMMVRVFLTCWLIYTMFWAPYFVREHYPALSLAEHGTLNVESYLGWTPDIFPGPRGGAYINNNPGASLIGALPLAIFRPLLRVVDQWNRKLPPSNRQALDSDVFWRTLAAGRAFYFLLAGFLTVALAMAPATAGVMAFLCQRLIQRGMKPLHAAGAALLVGLATPVLFRSAYLNHNLLVCDVGLAALLLLWSPADLPLHWPNALAAGLLAGYALLCDYSGIVVIAVTALYLWMRTRKDPSTARYSVPAACLAGIAVGVAALAIYQYRAFGSLIRPSQQYMTPTAHTSQGYRGFDWPSPALMWANFFDPRFGLFAYCPALLLAFAAPFVRNLGFRVPRREALVLWVYFGLFVFFCAANRYSWLQPNTGFRYLVPVVPALALLALQTAQALPRIVKWFIAIGACGQSLLMAAAHRNDIRETLPTLWHRRFAVPWILRFGDAGVSVNAWWTCAFYGILFCSLAALWWPARWWSNA